MGCDWKESSMWSVSPKVPEKRKATATGAQVWGRDPHTSVTWTLGLGSVEMV